MAEYTDVGGARIEKEKLDRLLAKGSGQALDNLVADFEIIEPPKRIAKLKGELVDLSFIPSIISLKFIAFSKKHDVKKFKNMEESDFDESLITDILEIVGSICEASNPKITAKWLFENLDLKDLIKFVSFVFEGVYKDKGGEGDTGGGETGKN